MDMDFFQFLPLIGVFTIVLELRSWRVEWRKFHYLNERTGKPQRSE